MRKNIILLVLLILLSVPCQVFAADFRFSIARGEDGNTLGELWYNGRIVWRVTLAADGAAPVSGGSGGNTTVLTPDIINGFFQIKIFNQ